MRGKFLHQCIWLLSLLQIIHPTISLESPPGFPRNLNHGPSDIPVKVENDHPFRPESSAQWEDDQGPPKRQRTSPDQLAATPIANTHEAFSRELDVGHHSGSGALSHDGKGKHPVQEEDAESSSGATSPDSQSSHSGPERSTPPRSTEGAEASHVQSTLAHTGAESSEPPTTAIQDLGPIPPSFPNVQQPGYIPMPPQASEKFRDDLWRSLTRFAAFEDDAELYHTNVIDPLPAEMVTYSNGQDAQGNKQKATFMRVLDSEGGYLSPEQIASRLARLFDYMVFNHALSASHLGAERQQTRMRECTRILQWLTSQLEDTRTSLPVVGEVRKHGEDRRFGEVQRWIIWYLHHGDPRSYAYTTSIALLWFWYRASAPNKLQRLEHTRQQLRLDSFWSLMRNLAAQPGPGAGWCKIRTFNKPSPLPPFLGQINLEDLRIETRSYNQWVIQFANYPQGAADGKIAADLMHAYVGYVVVAPPGRPVKPFYGTSALLQPCTKVFASPPHEVMYAVRLTEISGRLIPMPMLETVLKNLLHSCHWWHQNLSVGLMGHGILPIQGAHGSFLQWLASILFAKKHSLPVFGVVEQRSYDLFGGHPGFAQVQRFLIHHFSSNASPGQPSTVATDAIALLAYWYSSKQPIFWGQHLQTTGRVVNFIKTGLKHHFNLLVG